MMEPRSKTKLAPKSFIPVFDSLVGEIYEHCRKLGATTTARNFRQCCRECHKSPSIRSRVNCLTLGSNDHDDVHNKFVKLDYFPGTLRRLILVGLSIDMCETLMWSAARSTVQVKLDGVTWIELIDPNGTLSSHSIWLALLTLFPRFRDGSNSTLKIQSNAQIPTLFSSVFKHITPHTVALLSPTHSNLGALTALSHLEHLVVNVIHSFDLLMLTLKTIRHLKTLRKLTLNATNMSYHTHDAAFRLKLTSQTLRELRLWWTTAAPALDLSECPRLQKLCLQGVLVLPNATAESLRWMREAADGMGLCFEVGENKQSELVQKPFVIDIADVRAKADVFHYVQPALKTADAFYLYRLFSFEFADGFLEKFESSDLKMLKGLVPRYVTNCLKSCPRLDHLEFWFQNTEFPRDLLAAIDFAVETKRYLNIKIRTPLGSPAYNQAEFLKLQIEQTQRLSRHAKIEIAPQQASKSDHAAALELPTLYL